MSGLSLTKARTLPLIAGVTAVALLLAGIFAVVWEERAFHSEKIASANSQAQLLASIVTAALAFHSGSEVQEYLDALQTDTDVEAASIYDIEGKPIASFARKGAMPPAHLTQISLPLLQKNTLTITAPIQQRGMAMGTVYIRKQMEPLQRRLAVYAVVVVFTVLAALILLVLTLAYIAQRKSANELEVRAAALVLSNEQLQTQSAQREKAEAALRTAQKMEAMGRMTGGLAHDFNNLLHVLKLNLTALLWSTGAAANNPAREPIDICLRAIDRGASLVQQLLAFGRRQPLSPRPFDVNALIEQTAQLMYPILGTRIELRMQLSMQPCMAVADPHQLENAVLNLAINARDAMAEGGTLTISTSKEHIDHEDHLRVGDYAVITLRDTGSGIPPELLDKIFEPFFSTKGVGKGSGLGLSQVYGYIKQSGGGVRIHSDEGKGTQVTLLLPWAEAVEQKEINPPESNTEKLPSALTMLIVEDEPLVLRSAETLIQGFGVNTLSATDGNAALALLQSDRHIDILFSDILLPGGLNGLQIAKKALELRPSIKVLLTSGYAEQEIVGSEDMLAFPLLSKPYGPANLIVELKKLKVMH
jgi:signal transduction histidine kinase